VETQEFNPKFTPTKEATSPLRIPQREVYHQEPLFLFQSPQRKIGAHQEFSTKERVIQTISDAPHQEVTRRETPNHLEASFKSNKHESVARTCFKCSWDGEIRRGSQSFSNPHKESFLYPSPCSKESNLGSRGKGRSGVNAQVRVCPMVGQQWVRREKRGIYTKPWKLAITVQKRV
jgi:hypothetical protein